MNICDEVLILGVVWFSPRQIKPSLQPTAQPSIAVGSPLPAPASALTKRKMGRALFERNAVKRVSRGPRLVSAEAGCPKRSAGSREVGSPFFAYFLSAGDPGRSKESECAAGRTSRLSNQKQAWCWQKLNRPACIAARSNQITR